MIVAVDPITLQQLIDPERDSRCPTNPPQAIALLGANG
jgi:hypothetical protein